MLFATTRSKTETYTAHRVLHTDTATDGGLYLPYRMPVLEKSQILRMREQSFSQSVAQILNLFYGTGYSAWDIDCCIGKNAADMVTGNQKVFLLKLWDNPNGNISYITDRLYEKLCDGKPEKTLTNWARISIQIAVLFGGYSLLSRQEISSFDVAVNSGDFSLPMAAWYARYMGLPVGNIICACNENSAPWDFLHRGEMNTGLGVVSTDTPEMDIATPSGLERLVLATLGFDEAQRYVGVMAKRDTFRVLPDLLPTLNKGMFVSVAGKGRAESVITSVYKSTGIILDPYTAVSFGGVQDYRAKLGEINPTLLLWEKSPAKFMPAVQRATGLNQSDIENKLMIV